MGYVLSLGLFMCLFCGVSLLFLLPLPAVRRGKYYLREVGNPCGYFAFIQLFSSWSTDLCIPLHSDCITATLHKTKGPFLLKEEKCSEMHSDQEQSYMRRYNSGIH